MSVLHKFQNYAHEHSSITMKYEVWEKNFSIRIIWTCVIWSLNFIHMYTVSSCSSKKGNFVFLFKVMGWIWEIFMSKYNPVHRYGLNLGNFYFKMYLYSKRGVYVKMYFCSKGRVGNFYVESVLLAKLFGLLSFTLLVIIKWKLHLVINTL